MKMIKKEFRIGKKPVKKPSAAKVGKQESMKARVNKHEKDIADDLGGYRQPASGALEGMKGDVKLENFLIDSKETETNSLILSSKELTKITREARECGRDPAIVATIHKLPVTVAKEWVLIPMDVFAQMLDEVKKT
jgi:hypothetical protein